MPFIIGPDIGVNASDFESVFAVGDVTGRDALTPVAIAAGRRLADRLYGGMEGRHLEYDLVPTVVFSHPTIGTVGLSEAAARARYGDDVKVYTSGFTGMYYALGTNKKRSVMKLVTAGADEKVVGCHVIGEGADEIFGGYERQRFDVAFDLFGTPGRRLVPLAMRLAGRRPSARIVERSTMVPGLAPTDSMRVLIAAYSASLAGVILTAIVSGTTRSWKPKPEYVTRVSPSRSTIE